MKKVVLGVAVSIVIFLIGYYIVSDVFSEHSGINVGDVRSITINEVVFEADENPKEIAEFMKIYNSAKVLKKAYDTTPSYIIEIKLKNGKKIDMQGTTQGFHYVNDDEKVYKITSAEMTCHLKNIMK